MKEYVVIFSNKAEEDLNNIFAFVKEVSSKWEAEIVVRRIIKKAMRLDVFPERSEVIYGDKRGCAYRVVTSGRYRLVYVVKRQENNALIARIISVGQNTEDYLSEHPTE